MRVLKCLLPSSAEPTPGNVWHRRACTGGAERRSENFRAGTEVAGHSVFRLGLPRRKRLVRGLIDGRGVDQGRFGAIFW
jgi:hypothetical protein